MSQPACVAVVGALTVSPANPVSTGSNPGSTLSPTFNLASSHVYAEHLEASLSLANATDFPLPFGTVTHATLVYVKVISGTLSAKVTSTAGTDQQVTSSEFLVLSDPTGTGYTSVKLTGTADVEFAVAGS